MPSGIYERTETIKARLRVPHIGSGIYKRTLEHKNTLSIAKIGDKNPAWQGDNVKYRALHTWVQKKLGKPSFCEECGNTKLRHRQYHWSNTSGNYKRIISDWRRLCVKCHKIFDLSQKSLQSSATH